MIEMTQEMVDELAEKLFYTDTPWGTIYGRTWESRTELMLDICRGKAYKMLETVLSLKSIENIII